MKNFRTFCLSVLGFTLFVILWGAWVRFSHSGEGCGASWPLCNDQWIPDDSSAKTWTEWIHRATAFIFGWLTAGLLLWGFKIFPKNHKNRWVMGVMGVLTLLEALIGAGIVLKGLTGSNDSLSRMLVLNIHTLSSLCLIACPALLWRFSFKNNPLPKKSCWIISIFFLIAVMGSMTSLSNTLFPSPSLLQGLMMDFGSHSHWLIQWRIIHPLLAFVIGGSFLFYLFFKIQNPTKKNSSQNILKLLTGLLFLSFITGILNILALSPVVLKLIHILFVYSMWLAFLMLA